MSYDYASEIYYSIPGAQRFTLPQINAIVERAMIDVFNLNPEEVRRLGELGVDHVINNIADADRVLPALRQKLAPTITSYIYEVGEAIVKTAAVFAKEEWRHMATTATLAGAAVLAIAALYNLLDHGDIFPERKDWPKLKTDNEIRIERGILHREHPQGEPENVEIWSDFEKMVQENEQARAYRNKIVDRINNLDFTDPVQRTEVVILAKDIEDMDRPGYLNITETLAKTPVKVANDSLLSAKTDNVEGGGFSGFGFKTLNNPNKWDSFIDKVAERESSKGGASKPKAAKKGTPWTEHVKKYAKEHDKTFFESLKLAKASYKK